MKSETSGENAAESAAAVKAAPRLPSSDSDGSFRQAGAPAAADAGGWRAVNNGAGEVSFYITDKDGKGYYMGKRKAA